MSPPHRAQSWAPVQPCAGWEKRQIRSNASVYLTGKEGLLPSRQCFSILGRREGDSHGVQADFTNVETEVLGGDWTGVRGHSQPFWALAKREDGLNAS